MLKLTLKRFNIITTLSCYQAKTYIGYLEVFHGFYAKLHTLRRLSRWFRIIEFQVSDKSKSIICLKFHEYVIFLVNLILFFQICWYIPLIFSETAIWQYVFKFIIFINQWNRSIYSHTHTLNLNLKLELDYFLDQILNLI